MTGGSLIRSLSNLFESGLQAKATINPNAVGEGQEGTAEGAAVGEHQRDDLRGEQVQVLGRLSLQKAQKLVPGGAGRAGGDQAQHDVERQGGEDDVGILGVGGDDVLRQQKGDVGLVEDGFAEVHGYGVM